MQIIHARMCAHTHAQQKYEVYVLPKWAQQKYEVKSSSSKCPSISISFPYVEPPLWTTMPLLLRLRIFHLLDAKRGTFFFSDH